MAKESKEQHVPTKEEIVSMLKEQIEIRELQARLAELNTAIAVSRAKEFEALSFLGRSHESKQTTPGNVHVITQEDLDNNPELIDEGLKVGDEVIIPNSQQVVEAEMKDSKRSLKKTE
jgi:hypothetical protein